MPLALSTEIAEDGDSKKATGSKDGVGQGNRSKKNPKSCKKILDNSRRAVIIIQV